MLDAFEAGGDFHSRTAMNMYSYIRDAVDKKDVLLEWHPLPGEDNPPVPLLKDIYASERRKAKMLNFSIAYGKTPVGLARDWKVSLKEARDTVKLWYTGREEVLKWQEERKLEANMTQRVHTLLGRARVFPSTIYPTKYQKGHIEQAAINTPVQGSAADVAMLAMLQISKNVRLKELGWKLLLQIQSSKNKNQNADQDVYVKNEYDEIVVNLLDYKSPKPIVARGLLISQDPYKIVGGMKLDSNALRCLLRRQSSQMSLYSGRMKE